jgi:SAM-dependent methyltransferase
MPAHGSLGALFYDAERPPVADAELAWYAARLPREEGNVLDVLCGSGRLLVPLLQTGYSMHGVDPSAAMLESCAARLNATRARATLVRQEPDALNLPFRYAAAFIAGGAFQQLVDPVAARTALSRIRAHLVKPGVLLLDLFVPSSGAQRLGAALVEVRTARLADGTRIALRSETTDVLRRAHRAHAQPLRASARHGAARRGKPSRRRTRGIPPTRSRRS